MYIKMYQFFSFSLKKNIDVRCAFCVRPSMRKCIFVHGNAIVVVLLHVRQGVGNIYLQGSTCVP